MIFQILDDREQCFGIYSNGKFTYDKIPSHLNKTWDWSPHLVGRDVNYASLWTGGKKLGTFGPSHLCDRFELRSKRVKAFLNAVSNSKIKFNDVCLFDIIPEQHLKHYCETKNQLCEWVFENHEKPKNHQFLVDLSELVYDISQNILRIDLNRLFKHSKTDRKAYHLYRFINGKEMRVLYDIWGSVTGRLTTNPMSFPMLNLKKEIADCVVPKRDVFVQFDFNGSEIRTLLSLAEIEQPEEDIHEWNIKNIYPDIKTRDDAKKKFFAWLYNPNSSDKAIEKFYNRDQVLNKYYNNGIVSTPFGREIEADDFHALNYLLQSSSSDNCLHQTIKINKFLKGKKSFVHSVVHDSVTIDMSFEDKHLVEQIIELFEDTRLGKFKSSMSIGTNLKKLEEIQW